MFLTKLSKMCWTKLIEKYVLNKMTWATISIRHDLHEISWATWTQELYRCKSLHVLCDFHKLSLRTSKWRSTWCRNSYKIHVFHFVTGKLRFTRYNSMIEPWVPLGLMFDSPVDKVTIRETWQGVPFKPETVIISMSSHQGLESCPKFRSVL